MRSRSRRPRLDRADAQVGVGYRGAVVALLGGIAGAVAFGYAEPAIRPLLLEGGPGKITFANLTGAPYWILALGLAAILVLALYGLESWHPWRRELGRDVDGDFGEAGSGGTADLPGRHARPAE